MPVKPRPEPVVPSELGVAVAGSAITNVIPSAPVPLPIVASKDALRFPEGTAVGQNEDPDAYAVAGVSCNSDPAVVPNNDALPFSFHPPAVGSGITTPDTPVPESDTIALPAELATVSESVEVVAAVGANVTVGVTL